MREDKKSGGARGEDKGCKQDEEREDEDEDEEG